jgi:hypothetical protein
MSGRLAVPKAILLSQFVYFLQVQDTEENEICKRIQELLIDNLRGKTSSKWIAVDILTTSQNQGFFCITKFKQAI